MPNRNYIKGVRKERAIVNEARAKGLISLRSAGSHSPIDVVVIDKGRKIINLIQCKAGEFSPAQKVKLESMHWELEGTYQVKFYVV